jgi:hypothetical protein
MQWGNLSVKPELTETPQTERKVLRRGLLAGLAGLAAASLLKVTGPGKAEATDNAALVIGDDVQTGQTETRLTASPVNVNLPAFQVVNGGSATSGQIAVAGVTDGASGAAIVGVNTHASSGTGVRGVCNGINSAGIGVQGSTQLGHGVLGITSASATDKAGVEGRSFGASPATRGAHTNNGTAIKGVSNANFSYTDDGTGSGIGVHGKSSAGKGVFGQSTSSDGVHGTSSSGVGLRGTSAGFVGLVGISDQNIGLYGYTVAPNVPAFYAENLAASGQLAGYFGGGVVVTGNLGVYGAKNAIVQMPDGSDAVVYCQESPEPYFEDFGKGRLVNGVAHVQLEPEFASIVKRDDYMVFPVAEGESKGHLFISQKNANGFDVREANGGTSSIPFTYRVVAKRKDIEGKRLERLDPKVKANIGQMRAAAAARNHPGAKVPPGGNPLVPLEPTPSMPEPPAPRNGP